MKSIFTRNSIYFYISFFSAGAQNIIPQLFFSSYYPDRKGLLLPIILILGSLAAVLGVLVSGKQLVKNAGLAISLLFLTILGFCSMLLTKNIYIFIGTFTFTSFGCNYLYNYFDNYYLKRTHEKNVQNHIKIILLYQLLGYMLSPLYFSYFAQKGILTLLPVIIVFSATAYFVVCFVKAQVKPAEHGIFPATGQKDGVSLREKLYILYAFLYMVVELTLLSLLVYILSDYYKFSDYAAKSGIVMLEIVLMSCLTVLLFNPHKGLSEIKDRHLYEGKLFNPKMNALSVILTAVTIILLLLRLSSSFWYVMLALAFVGPGYGCFITLTRSYASKMDTLKGRNILLSAYNSIQNLSAILGQCIVLGCYFLAPVVGADYLGVMIALSIGILIFTLILIIVWHVSWKKEVQNEKSLHEKGFENIQ